MQQTTRSSSGSKGYEASTTTSSCESADLLLSAVACAGHHLEERKWHVGHVGQFSVYDRQCIHPCHSMALFLNLVVSHTAALFIIRNVTARLSILVQGRQAVPGMQLPCNLRPGRCAAVTSQVAMRQKIQYKRQCPWCSRQKAMLEHGSGI